MAYAEKRGKGPAPWRVKYKLPSGEEASESGFETKAAARLIPCTFIGKHLRFSDDDIAEIMRAGARQPITARERTRRASTA